MSQVAFVCHRLGSLSPADLTFLHIRRTGTEDSRLPARTAYRRAVRGNAGTPSACPQRRGQCYGRTLLISSRHLHKPRHHKIKLSNKNEKVYIRMMKELRYGNIFRDVEVELRVMTVTPARFLQRLIRSYSTCISDSDWGRTTLIIHLEWIYEHRIGSRKLCKRYPLKNQGDGTDDC